MRRIAVTYATHDETGAPGSTNLVKPVYHVAWLASRLGLDVVEPLATVADKGAASTGAAHRRAAPGPKPIVGRGAAATLSDGRSEVAVWYKPVISTMPAGTTLRVELLAERRGSELRADVTAEAETVHVRVWQDGFEALDRHFLAARRGDVDLLAEAIEAGRRDPVTSRDAARRRGARRPGRPLMSERPDRHRADRCGDRGRGRRRSTSRRPCARRSTPAAWRTGRRPAARRRRRSTAPCAIPDRPATRSRGQPSTSGGATTASCRATIPLSNVKPFDDIVMDIGGPR